MAKAVKFNAANRVYKADGMQDLHVFANGVCVVSCWQLTPSEIESVVRTGKVFVSTLSGDIVHPLFVGDNRTVPEVVAQFGQAPMLGVEDEVKHNGRVWEIIEVSGSYFARSDSGGATGPFSTVEAASDWVTALVQ